VVSLLTNQIVDVFTVASSFWLLVNRVISPFLKVFFGTLQNLEQSLVLSGILLWLVFIMFFTVSYNGVLRVLYLGFLSLRGFPKVFLDTIYKFLSFGWIALCFGVVVQHNIAFSYYFSSLFIKMDIVFIKVCPSGSFILCSYFPGF